MPRTVIAQISDTHIPGRGEETHAGADPVGNLTAALAHASQRCAGVVITGDCAAKAGTDAEYAAFAEVIATATVPVWLAPGNHDDSAKMQRLFNLPSVNGRCDYVVDLPGGRLVVLDTSRPGREDGSLDVSQTEWLDHQLRGHHSLVVMHHPCIRVGGRVFDSIRLDDDSVQRLTDVVERHEVFAVSAGHAHMSCFAAFAGTQGMIAPSCAYEFGIVDGAFSYQLGEPQYLEHSWSTDGSNYLARVVTVEPALWRSIR
ncbi:MAG: metallophosphoesterase [Ilumatobacteraceae bacterium]